MIENLLDPLVLFFVLGFIASLMRADVRLHPAFYETLSIYLLLAIGLKGGVEMRKAEFFTVLPPMLGTLILGIIIPLIAFSILYYLGKFKRADAAALAAHYGSVSAVTYAIALTFLDRQFIPYEGFMALLLVLLEIPAIAVAILLARSHTQGTTINYSHLAHEMLFNKSIYLLIGGLCIGAAGSPERMMPIQTLFFDAFKGILAFFLLEMGLLASQRLSDLRTAGFFLFGFAVLMPLLSGFIGAIAGVWMGLSLGGTMILATLAASASYIAAPAAVRIAIPEANPTYYLTAAIGITFPFNIIVGVPIYYFYAQQVHSWF